MIDEPHISYPFRLNAAGTGAVAVEQDSEEEIMDCVEVLIRTPLGFRLEAPDYGVRPQEFREGGADIEEINTAINEWEDRAHVIIERQPDALHDLVDRVRIGVSRRGDG